jgi:hypothetical protein
MVLVLHEHPAVLERDDVRTDGVDAIAVTPQLEVPDDPIGHQAHHVRQRRDAELRMVRPRGVGGGGAARLVPRLADDDPGAGLRQVGGRDEAVMTAADHDHVVPVRPQDSSRKRRPSAQPAKAAANSSKLST